MAETFYQLLTWLLAMVLGTSGFALIMKYGPDRRPAKWRWLSPGSLLATFACRSVETLLVFGSAAKGIGRVYSVAVGSLPGGRGDGVPVTRRR